MQTDVNDMGDRHAIVVNANLAIEVSEDEILADLLYPAKVETAR